MASQNNKNLFSTAASIAASAMLIRSIANEFLPRDIQHYFFSIFGHLSRNFSSDFTIVIEEFQGHSINQAFEAAHTYLGTKLTPSTRRIKLGKVEKDKTLAITIDRDEVIVDRFENIHVTWTLVCTQISGASGHYSDKRDLNSSLRSETRSYELSFNKKHKEKVLNSYLPYIMERSKAIKEETKTIELHTAAWGNWGSEGINLDHPMSFKSLAIDSELKNSIVDDLERFSKGRDFYQRIGKAWKRGYLLYGPPGTGKSSLIAAMANHLKFDIYDLDLSDVQSNSDLRSLLLGMSSKSILVIEDIDCTIKLQNREVEDEPNDDQKVTLSALLNCIDGLWSCCGEERIIIFTTNHKERLDPALLRPGRMDMHIEMSYCNFSAFKQLVFNYFGVDCDEVFDRIGEVLRDVEVTPAEVAGELMKSSDAKISLHGLLKFLQKKKMERDMVKIDN